MAETDPVRPAAYSRYKAFQAIALKITRVAATFSFPSDSLQRALISAGHSVQHEENRSAGTSRMTGDHGVPAPVRSPLLTGDGQAPAAHECLVEITVPVYNEQKILAQSIHRLHAYLTANLPFHFLITIADNASSDGTFRLAQQLSAELPGVRAVHLDHKGRGLALRHVWSRSEADVVAYMDADLSTDMDAFLPLIAPLLSGHSDLAIGSRLMHGAQVVRGPRREIISRAYNLLLRAALSARFSDAQCGFKAGRADVVKALLPSIRDDSWFFDTELLIVAQRSGLRIYQVPVAWTEDPDTKVDVARTALDDLRGVARLRFHPSGKQALSPGRLTPVPGEHDLEPGTPCRSAHSELTAPEQPR